MAKNTMQLNGRMAMKNHKFISIMLLIPAVMLLVASCTDAGTSSKEAPGSSGSEETESVAPSSEEPTDAPTESEEVTASQPENDLGKTIEQDGFSVIVEKIEQDGDQVTVHVVLKTAETQDLWATNRFRLINAKKETLYLSLLLDEAGNNRNGGSITANEEERFAAEFQLTDGFEPVEFRYVYDIQGFRDLRVKL